MKWESFANLIIKFRLWALAHSYISNTGQGLFLPSFRHAIHNFGVLMAGEAQVYKPLFIQPLSRFFQQFDLLSVVLDEVVIGEENIGNPTLVFYGRHSNFNVF